MSRIYIDCDNARRQARALENVAQECREVIRNLEETKNDALNCWEGEAADAFQLALQKRIKEIYEIENGSRQLATKIYNTIEKIKDTEEKVRDTINSFGMR